MNQTHDIDACYDGFNESVYDVFDYHLPQSPCHLARTRS